MFIFKIVYTPFFFLFRDDSLNLSYSFIIFRAVFWYDCHTILYTYGIMLCSAEFAEHNTDFLVWLKWSLLDDTTKGTVKNELDHIVWQKVAGW